MAELTAAGKALREPGGIERELAKVREYKAEVERLLEGREGSIELLARVKYLSELEQELLKLQRVQSKVERLERWQGLIPNYDPWVGLSILPVLLYVLVLELFGTRAAIGAGLRLGGGGVLRAAAGAAESRGDLLAGGAGAGVARGRIDRGLDSGQRQGVLRGVAGG